jgi:acetyl-CoA carboxylase biotin carboxyl carrier protein
MQVVPVVPWSVTRIESSAAYPAGIVPAGRRTGPRRKRTLPDVEAHITGTVWKIECEIGQAVEEGDTLVILESMKMEMPVEAEDDGTVKEIVCSEGQSVSEGDTLVVLE